MGSLISDTHFNGVADKVGDNLLQPERVTDEVVWDPRVDVVYEVELVLGGLGQYSRQNALISDPVCKPEHLASDAP